MEYIGVVLWIGSGFLANIIIYIIFNHLIKTKMSILRIVWYVALIIFVGSVTIISLIFGGWIALGGFMIGIGLIMAAIVLSIYELIKSNLTH